MESLDNLKNFIVIKKYSLLVIQGLKVPGLASFYLI